MSLHLVPLKRLFYDINLGIGIWIWTWRVGERGEGGCGICVCPDFLNLQTKSESPVLAHFPSDAGRHMITFANSHV